MFAIMRSAEVIKPKWFAPRRLHLLLPNKYVERVQAARSKKQDCFSMVVFNNFNMKMQAHDLEDLSLKKKIG